jgi:hypothetical protein
MPDDPKQSTRRLYRQEIERGAMSNQLCVCGHLYDDHLEGSNVCEHDNCPCIERRLCLPWPDSTGNWWCDKFDIPLKVSSDVHGFIVGEHDTWFRQKEFESLLCGPARFTKLLEQNPFAALPTESETT